MTKQFKVGDVCIGQNIAPVFPYNGMECEIVGGLCERETFTTYGPLKMPCIAICYQVLWADGTSSEALHSHLRLKKPPTTYKGEQRIIEMFNPAKAPMLEGV